MKRLLALLLLAASEDCEETATDSATFLQKTLQLELKAEKRKSSDVETFHYFAHFSESEGFATLLNVLAESSHDCSSCGMKLYSCQEEGLSEAECAAREQPVAWSFGIPVGADCESNTCSARGGLRLLHAAAGGDLSAVNATDLAGLANLWPDRWRMELLVRDLPAREWPDRVRILMTTVLSDPLQRLRSFYLRTSDGSDAGFKAFLVHQHHLVTGNTTAPVTRKALEACCEYSLYLGEGDVAQAKRVLASQFDLLGIAEQLPETLAALAWLYQKHAAGMGVLARDIGLQAPETYTYSQEELALAENITRKDREVYHFARRLFQRQSVSMWNTPETLQTMAQRAEAARVTA